VHGSLGVDCLLVGQLAKSVACLIGKYKIVGSNFDRVCFQCCLVSAKPSLEVYQLTIIRRSIIIENKRRVSLYSAICQFN